MLKQEFSFGSLRNNEPELAQFYGALIYDFLQRRTNHAVDDLQISQGVLGLDEQALKLGLEWCAHRGYVTYTSSGRAEINYTSVAYDSGEPLPFVWFIDDEVWQRILKAAEDAFAVPTDEKRAVTVTFWDELRANSDRILIIVVILFGLFMAGYFAGAGGETLIDALIFGFIAALVFTGARYAIVELFAHPEALLPDSGFDSPDR